MRNRNALPHAGGAETFAFDQRFEDAPLGQMGERGGAFGQFLQQLLLALHLERRNYGFGCEQIGDFHDGLLSADQGWWLLSLRM